MEKAYVAKLDVLQDQIGRTRLLTPAVSRLALFLGGTNHLALIFDDLFLRNCDAVRYASDSKVCPRICLAFVAELYAIFVRNSSWYGS